MTRIQEAAERLIAKHNGLRAAARATGLDHAYLSRLRNGLKADPGENVLAILGLDRHVIYKRRRNSRENTRRRA
jgi:hypothetical protein